MKWFERTFAFDLPIWMAPNITERLRGTPARLEDRLQGTPTKQLVHKEGETWSVQEQVGHLLDLESLWLGRMDDLRSGSMQLRDADLENTKTHEAGHNNRPLVFLLSEFRKQRTIMIDRIDAMALAEFETSALHPRLKQPMRLIDLMFFVAEHDDHHLATISRLLKQNQPTKP